MDYEAVRAGLAQAIPNNNHLRLELAGVAEGRGSVRLPDDDELKNHAGT
jgi:acyl-coenzyme A thioesterase PaaI-like protein